MADNAQYFYNKDLEGYREYWPGPAGGPLAQTSGAIQANPWDNPLDLGNVLGAYALGIGTGGPTSLVVNPTPQPVPGGKAGKGGVFSGPQYPTVASPAYAQGLPQGPWTQVPGVFTQGPTPTVNYPSQLSLPQITPRAQPTAAQYTPYTQPGAVAPGLTIGGGMMPPGGMPSGMPGMPPGGVPPMMGDGTPTMGGMPGGPSPIPGPQPGPIAGIPPYGGFPGMMGPPPPAPGVPFVGTASQAQSNLLATHTAGLVDAGKAIFAHFGGDPNTATPADIALFHGQLQSAIGGTAPPSGAPAREKKQAGGIVHGSPGPDQVPAMLTAGEFVVNKDAVNRIGLGNLEAMNRKKFADGGPVEAQHGALSVTQGSSGTTQGPAGPGYASQTGQGGQSQSGQQSDLSGGIVKAVQAYGARTGGLGTPANPSSPYYSPGQGYIGPSQMAGTSGYIYPTAAAAASGQPGATTQAGWSRQAAGWGTGQPTQSALSTIGSGLQQAGQQIASSVKPWQMQQSAIPTPPPYQGPSATFTQEPVQNAPQRTPYNPYMNPYMMGLV